VDCTVSPQRRKLRPNLGRICVPVGRLIKMRQTIASTFFLARSKLDRFGRLWSIYVGPLEMLSVPRQ
jgi:hypothetical protein